MIIEPTITELSKHADCRYTLVVTAARRARQLIDGAPPLLDMTETKPLSIAVREINKGLIAYDRTLEA